MIDPNYKKDIYNKFYRDIFPKLKEIETYRIVELVKMCVFEFAAIFICVLCICNFSNLPDWIVKGNNGIINLIKTILLFFIMPVLPFIIPPLINEHFQEKLKDKLMSKVVKCFPDLTNGRGHFKNGLSWNVLERSKLFNFDSYLSFIEDTFHGKYNGATFAIAEVNLCKQARKAGSVTTFKGAIISFACNKEIKAHTLITSKSKKRKIFIFVIVEVIIVIWMVRRIWVPFSAIESWLDLLLNFTNILFASAAVFLLWWFIHHRKLSQKVKLESNMFDKRYNVESDDQIEARYLITPAFMERFYNLTTEFGTKDIQCAFFDNRVLFAISTNKNLFELGSIYKTLTNPQNVKLFDELISIIDMIDYFKLDEKTGL